MNINIVEVSNVLGILFILFTAVTVILEYRQQGRQKRAVFFSDKVDTLWNTESYVSLMEGLVDKDHKTIESISLSDKIKFINVLEEIAIMMNSGLIRKELASYMFGYHTIACWESEDFWNTDGLNKNSKHWTVLRNFASTMKEQVSTPSFGKKNIHF